ncbi:MAG: hypothetical protein A2X86_21155 [Bdellovibrionales bacterium GWA2_49_15]|nr:MAG: hypothetical protein A2X86_21155 [Bdellovibrionales bacterium GWA2_49_15]HAZ14887.1 hypothetical protein [Bdellovibrionales bacterium]
MLKALLLTFFLTSFFSFALEVPTLTGPVVDLAGVLTHNEQNELAQALANFQNRFGPQIQILIIRDLEGEVIENFSIKVVDKWKLGDQKRHDGLLLLLAIKDRAVRLEVGRGLEETLTDLTSAHIIRQMTPYFKEQRYAQGIVSGVSSIMAALGGELENIPLKEEVQSHDLLSNAITVFFLLILIIFTIARRKRRSILTGFGWRGGFGTGGGFSSGSWSGGGGGFAGGGSSGKW